MPRWSWLPRGPRVIPQPIKAQRLLQLVAEVNEIQYAKWIPRLDVLNKEWGTLWASGNREKPPSHDGQGLRHPNPKELSSANNLNGLEPISSQSIHKPRPANNLSLIQRTLRRESNPMGGDSDLQNHKLIKGYRFKLTNVDNLLCAKENQRRLDRLTALVEEGQGLARGSCYCWKGWQCMHPSSDPLNSKLQILDLPTSRPEKFMRRFVRKFISVI